jgi:hypothetical protein
MSCCNAKDPKAQCPSKMSDGRAFTDYRPRCAVNAELMQEVIKNNMIQSSYESRMYLQKNAEYEMEKQRNSALERLIPCAPCHRPFSDPGTMYPERYIVRCDATSCTKQEVFPAGLGDGRAY